MRAYDDAPAIRIDDLVAVGTKLGRGASGRVGVWWMDAGAFERHSNSKVFVALTAVCGHLWSANIGLVRSHSRVQPFLEAQVMKDWHSFWPRLTKDGLKNSMSPGCPHKSSAKPMICHESYFSRPLHVFPCHLACPLNSLTPSSNL